MIGYRMALMPLPMKVSLLRSNHQTMGLVHKEKNFVIGFPLRHHAVEMQKYVHAASKIQLNEIVYGTHKISRLYISKKVNINKLPCSIMTMDLTDVLIYPLAKNVGVVFALEIMENNPEEYVFDCEYVEPFYNPDIFRAQLDSF